MGSSNMIVGDAVADKPVKNRRAAQAISARHRDIHDGIDRVLLTSTVRASDLGDAGEDDHGRQGKQPARSRGPTKFSAKPSPGGEAPVEVHVRARRQSAGGLRDEHVRRHSKHGSVGIPREERTSRVQAGRSILRR